MCQTGWKGRALQEQRTRLSSSSEFENMTTEENIKIICLINGISTDHREY